MSETATLKVWRGAGRKSGRFESYDVPFERGQSVLDGLRWIRANKDPSLAIRFSCINANACKECMMELDGKTVYACTARLEPREMRVTPLSNKALVRDLVTDIAPPAERFTIPQPSPPRAGEVGERSPPGGGIYSKRKGPLPNPPPHAGEGEKKR
jgi:succinate dehydrogenase/fumarate reductase-like Fe-S protein